MKVVQKDEETRGSGDICNLDCSGNNLSSQMEYMDMEFHDASSLGTQTTDVAFLSFHFLMYEM